MSSTESSERSALIERLARGGAPVEEIARRLGISTRTVYRHTNVRTGPKRVTLTPDLLASIGHMVAEEVPVEEICRTFGIAQKTVRSRFDITYASPLGRQIYEERQLDRAVRLYAERRGIAHQNITR